MSPDASSTPTLGHNSQTDLEILRDKLDMDFDPLKQRRDELLAAVDRIPNEIADDETAGRVADQIKQINAATKSAKSGHSERKDPFLQSGRLVDSFFKGITDPLAKAKSDAQSKLTAFDRKKAAEERRRREEADRKAREQAERAAREAAEAAEKLESDTDLEAAITAEEIAAQARADAAAAEKAAQARAANLHTTRGDYGASSSLRTTWKHKNLNRNTIDLEALRPHLSDDALEKAVRSFIKTGARELKGVEIYAHEESVVR